MRKSIIICGRVDPTPFFDGIAAEGTITPSEEDDLALFENETVFRDKVILAVFDAQFDARDENTRVTRHCQLARRAHLLHRQHRYGQSPAPRRAVRIGRDHRRGP